MEIVPQYFSAFQGEMDRFITEMRDFKNEMHQFAKNVHARFDRVDEKLDIIAMTVNGHNEVLDEHSILLRAMTGRHDNHEDRISSLERSVTRLRLKIDN